MRLQRFSRGSGTPHIRRYRVGRVNYSGNLLRIFAPRRGRRQRRAIGAERFHRELVGVHFAGWGRRTDEAFGKGAEWNFPLSAIIDRAAAMMEARFVEIGHMKVELRRA